MRYSARKCVWVSVVVLPHNSYFHSTRNVTHTWQNCKTSCNEELCGKPVFISLLIFMFDWTYCENWGVVRSQASSLVIENCLIAFNCYGRASLPDPLEGTKQCCGKNPTKLLAYVICIWDFTFNKLHQVQTHWRKVYSAQGLIGQLKDFSLHLGNEILNSSE